MLELRPGIRLCQRPEDLPNLRGCKNLFLDVETTAFDDKIEALHPYQGHRICGIAVTADDIEGAWYIPVRHEEPDVNLDINIVIPYIRDLITSCENWINHNVKFDAHFLSVDGAIFTCRLVDTVSLAKIHDSDRFTHSLKPLCREWCDLPMEEATEVDAYLKGIKSKNYAKVPCDLLGRYACMDVIGNRILYKFLLANKIEEQNNLWETEIKLTPVLFDMERKGVRINKTLVLEEQEKSIMNMIAACEIVHDKTGVELVDSADCFYEIICNQMGLPILARNDGKYGEQGNPSFDKAAMQLYSQHPEVLLNAQYQEIIKNLLLYREEQHYNGLFLDPFLNLADSDGRIHCNYNQNVRTGRMSCLDPNLTQLSGEAKALIIPDDDCGFLCQDASQVEYRVAMHYAGNEEAIRLYNEDPETDYHQWVTNLCRIKKRKTGKMLNLGMGYGMGKRKLTTVLSYDPDIGEEVSAQIDEEIKSGALQAELRAHRHLQLCTMRAEEIYNTYHDKIPEIKIVTEKARALCAQRGYIKNAYGRRRHLPAKLAYRAFPSLNQSCTADLVKERMVAMSPRYNTWTRDLGIIPIAQVHDELLEEGSKEVLSDPKIQAEFLQMLSELPVKLRVPIVWEQNYSDKNWKEAKPE